MDSNEIFGGEQEKYDVYSLIAGTVVFFIGMGAIVLITYFLVN
jgi:hypothetical protein